MQASNSQKDKDSKLLPNVKLVKSQKKNENESDITKSYLTRDLSLSKLKNSKLFKKFLEQEGKSSKQDTSAKQPNLDQTNNKTQELSIKNTSYETPKEIKRTQSQSKFEQKVDTERSYESDNANNNLNDKYIPYKQQETHLFNVNDSGFLGNLSNSNINFRQFQQSIPIPHNYSSQNLSQHILKKSPDYHTKDTNDPSILDNDKELIGFSDMVPGVAQMKMSNQFMIGQYNQGQYNQGQYNQGQIPVNIMPPYIQQQYYPYSSMLQGFYVEQNPYNNFQTQSSIGPLNDITNEIMMYKGKLIELNQQLTQESDLRKNYEKKCNDYKQQIDLCNKNFEDYKNNIQTSSKNQHQEIIEYEQKINQQNQHILEQERIIEKCQMELDNLKKKIIQETNVKIRAEEQAEVYKNRLDEILYKNKSVTLNIFYQFLTLNYQREKDDILDQRVDEVQNFKKHVDSLKNEINMLRLNESKHIDKIKDQEFIIMRLKDEINDYAKKLKEFSDKILDYEHQLDNMQQQNMNLVSQIKNKSIENETLKNEMYDNKQQIHNLEKRNLNNDLTIEKYIMEINQLQNQLGKAERNLEAQRQSNLDLVKQLTTIAQVKSNYVSYGYNYDQNIPRGSLHENLEQQISINDNQIPYINQNTFDTKLPTKIQQQQQQQQQQQSQYQQYQYQQQYQAQQHKIGNQQIELNKPDESAKQIQNQYQMNNKDNLNDKPQSRYTNKTTNNLLTWDDTKIKNETVRKPLNQQNNIIQKQLQQKSPNQQNINNNVNDKYQIHSINQENSNNFSISTTDQTNELAKEIAEKTKRTEQVKGDIAQHQQKAVKEIESNLMNYQIEKTRLGDELQKIEEQKIKTQAFLKRKKEIENELKLLNTNISNLKIKLREMNALHSY